jgi:hypothetical protein
VGRVGIERHVADDADGIAAGRADGADGAADEILRVEGVPAVAGMPSRRASSTARTTPAIPSRSTPGMLGTGALASCSCTNSGQTRSAGESTVSATARLSHSCCLLRRSRVAGNPPG